MNRRTRVYAGFLVLSVVLSRTSSVLAVKGVGEVDTSPVIWSQPPIEIDPNLDETPVFWGWDEPARSTAYEGQRRQWRMDADDFRGLDAVPLTGIRWWGGYKAWVSAQPPAAPQPTAWHIGIWANTVEGLEPNDLYPERLVWSVEIPGERVKSLAVGLDQGPGRSPEMCFVCEIGLEPEEWFHAAEFSTNEGVFWISITAIYPSDAEAINMWGWRTRPHLWGNGAVMPAIMGEWPTDEERLFPGRIYPIENAAVCGVSQACDLCFELLTDESRIQCDQPFTRLRDWSWYADEMADALEQENGELLILRQVADDWVCQRQDAIVAASWWGSYFGYAHEACGDDEISVPRRPDYFLLSLWNTEPSDDWEPYAHPGEKVWEYAAYDYDEVLIGCDRNPQGEPNEPVFRYSVTLPEEAWFRETASDRVYWFSVVPVFKEPVGDRPYHWGWTNHSQDSGSRALFVDYRLRMAPQWQPVPDVVGQPVDMSFTLFTAPESEPNVESAGD